MDKVYVHDGGKFDINKFTPIKNRDFVKPFGGLWGSPVDSNYGWREWCKANNFGNDRYDDESNSFMFKLKPDAKLLYIDNADMLKELPIIHNEIFDKCCVLLDFEKLAENYDAIEVSISSDRQLYWDLYGWDVDSILVMNPNAIEVIGDIV